MSRLLLIVYISLCCLGVCLGFHLPSMGRLPQAQLSEPVTVSANPYSRVTKMQSVVNRPKQVSTGEDELEDEVNDIFDDLMIELALTESRIQLERIHKKSRKFWDRRPIPRYTSAVSKDDARMMQPGKIAVGDIDDVELDDLKMALTELKRMMKK